MKSFRLLRILSLVLCVILGSAVVSVEAATLNITATDARTGNKLSGVSITVTPETGDAIAGVSDASGTLAIADLAGGVYTIVASSPNYVDAVVADVRFAADEAKTIEIVLSSKSSNLNRFPLRHRAAERKCLRHPASVALVSNAEIRDRVAPSVTEHLKSVRAVDVISAGLGAFVCCCSWFQQRFLGIPAVAR